MTDSSDITHMSFGYDELTDIPVGSLILLAHAQPNPRDALLTSLAFGATVRDFAVTWLTLTESPDAVIRRLSDHAHETMSRWAHTQARKDVPEPAHPNWDSSDPESAKAARRAYDALCKDADTLRDATAQSIYRKSNKEWRDSVAFNAIKPAERRVDRVEDLETLYEGSLLCIDNIFALNRPDNKPPTQKSCGDFARHLKELAVDHGLVVIAGMPAPARTETKKRYDGRKYEVPVPTTLADLTAYGAPNDSADIVITFTEADQLANTPPSWNWKTIQNRYRK